MNKTSLSILLVFLVRGVFSAVKPPCRATEGYYYDKEFGRCRRCIPCTKRMGIGFGRNLSEQISFHPTFGHTQCLSCRKCPDGYYNNGSYDECKKCDVDCKKKHREEYSPCNYRSFAQCGKCLDGFYDPHSNKEYDCEPLPEVLPHTQDAHTEATTTRFLESSDRHSNGGYFLTATVAIGGLVAVALIALLVWQKGPCRAVRKIHSRCCYQADSPSSSSESMVKSPVNSKSEVNHRVIDLSSSSLEEDSGDSMSGSSNESMVKSPITSQSELKHRVEAVIDLSSCKLDEDGDRDANTEQQPLLRQCRRELESTQVFCEHDDQQQEVVPQQKPPKETVETSQVVTPAHLNFISSQMDGDGDWERLFVEIEMPALLVSQFKVEWKMRESWDFKYFIYKVLERWCQVKAKDATFGKLYRAIMAVNYTGLVHSIKEKYNVVEPCRVEVHR